MINYLYYKLYQASLKSSLRDIPYIFASALLGGLISVNIIVLNAFLAKTGVLPFLFSSPKQGGWITAAFIVLVMLYYRKDKREAILQKYSQESEGERKKGNAIVAVYVGISFLLIFAVAFYKPGKL